MLTGIVNSHADYLLNVYIASSLSMFFFWLLQCKTKNASIVDALWSLGIALVGIYFGIILQCNDLRHTLILILVLAWSLRLALHIGLRSFKSQHEDRRYQHMRQYFGTYAQGVFFIFYQFQAILILLFVFPFFLALQTTSIQIGMFDIIGYLIMSVAIIGETVADQQLASFKQHNPQSRQTCRLGLWKYSRHPNYFFEWIHWFAYPCFTFADGSFIVTLCYPLVMWFFLVKLTGIPHLEREALKSKKDYKQYIDTTSMLIPWKVKVLDDKSKCASRGTRVDS